jgi:hypothetical protein
VFLRECSLGVTGKAARASKEEICVNHGGGLAMIRQPSRDEVRLPSNGDSISAVTILDHQGRVVRVVPAHEFRRGPLVRRNPMVSRRGSGASQSTK